MAIEEPQEEDFYTETARGDSDYEACPGCGVYSHVDDIANGEQVHDEDNCPEVPRHHLSEEV